MNRLSRNLKVMLATTAMVMCAAVAYQALAQRAIGPAAPVVAAVRMESLFDQLAQRATAKVELNAMVEEIQKEQARRQEKILQLQTELENVVAPAKREELRDELTLEKLKAQFWLKEATAELEIERAIRVQDLYRSIKEAVAALAAAEGYDLIIVNDTIDIPPFVRESQLSPQLQVVQEITNRKILYLNLAIDITEDLIVRMNNAHLGP